MSNIRKFDFNKSYEEIEIAGESYKIEFNDEKLLEYSKAFDSFYVETKRIDEMDTEGMDVEQQQAIIKEMQELIREILGVILGEGAYDKLYEASGQSLMNMISAIEFISEVVGEKMESIQASKKKKYLKKKKK